MQRDGGLRVIAGGDCAKGGGSRILLRDMLDAVEPEIKETHYLASVLVKEVPEPIVCSSDLSKLRNNISAKL